MSEAERSEPTPPAELPVYIQDNYSDRDRLYVQFSQFRELFLSELERVLRYGGLSADPESARWRMIDIASGEGLYSAAVLERYPHASIVCVDIDREAMATGSNAFAQIGDIRFYARDFLAPLPNEFEPGIAATGFDVAVLWFALCHLSDGVVALSHVAQLLKPGGVVLIFDPGGDVGGAMAKFPHPSFGILMKAFSRVHARIGNPESGKHHETLLRGAGFTDVKSRPVDLDIGGKTPGGRVALSLLVLGLQSARRMVVEIAQVMDGAEFDEHHRRLLTEVTPDMHAHQPMVVTMARRV
jgi:SAM-dependent methyltransferase